MIFVLGACWDGIPRGRIELNLVIFVMSFVKYVKSPQNVDAKCVDR